jgi:hypothetical protein
MWRLASATFALALAACASVPPSTSNSAAAQWSSYRSRVLQERDEGALTALQAEEKLRDKYRELYGPDPTMEGAFAYERDLYAAADAGKLPMAEAHALADARIDEIVQRRVAHRAYYDWLESRFPRDMEE